VKTASIIITLYRKILRELEMMRDLLVWIRKCTCDKVYIIFV